MTAGFCAAIGIQPERAHASRDHQANVAIPDFIAATGLNHGLDHLLVGHGDRQQDGLGGTEQPVDMLVQFEHAAIIGSDAFEHAVAIKQPVIEHRDLGVLFVQVFAVDKDFHGFKPPPDYVKPPRPRNKECRPAGAIEKTEMRTSPRSRRGQRISSSRTWVTPALKRVGPHSRSRRRRRCSAMLWSCMVETNANCTSRTCAVQRGGYTLAHV